MSVVRVIELWVSTAWRASRWMTVAMCLCTVLWSTLPAISVLGISRAIEAYAAHRSVWPGIGVAAAALLVTAVAAEATWPLSDTVQDLVDRHVHDDLLRLTAGIPSIAHHDDPVLADRLGLIERDTNALVGGPRLIGTLGSVASTVTVISLLASVQPVLCLLLVVAALPAAVEAAGARRRQRAQLDTERYHNLANRCVDALTAPNQGVEVRCFGLADPLLGVCGDAMWRRAHPLVALTKRFAGFSAISWLIFGVAYALAVGWILDRLRGGQATVGDLSLLLLVGAQIVAAGRAVTSNVRTVADQLQAFGRYQWLRDYAMNRRPANDETASPPAALHDGIRLQGVSFGYAAGTTPTGHRDALRSVDLYLPAGTTVALVGDNGAGKSTLVKLLARLYDPDEGEVLVDGVALRSVDPAAWRGRLCAGFQDYATFEFLAADSIGVGDLRHRTDHDRLAHAVAAGQARPVIVGLPAGLDTQLGTAFDGGVGLSGGQWQRLALARAFMRRSPLLMLLDEPTAALDPETEHALYDQYTASARQLARSAGTITVVVSHRFSTVRLADLIVVMHDGRVVEVGSHNDLVRAGGRYADLFALQADAYRQ